MVISSGFSYGIAMSLYRVFTSQGDVCECGSVFFKADVFGLNLSVLMVCFSVSTVHEMGIHIGAFRWFIVNKESMAYKVGVLYEIHGFGFPCTQMCT